MSNDHKSKPKKSKDKFETTTLLKLPPEDFEEEITINEPGKSTKKKKSSTSDEETVKMTAAAVKQEAKTSVEELLQKKALERKEQKQQKKSKQPSTVYISKSKNSVYSNVLLEIPDKKPVSKRVLFMLALLVIVSLVAVRSVYYKGSSAPPAKKPAKIQEPTLKLSAIKLYDDSNGILNSKNLQAGQTFSILFTVQDWTSVTAPNLEASVRVYDHTGRMLYFKPAIATFNTPSDPKSNKIELLTHFELGPDTPPGFYKLMLYITESETGLTSERQARIKVVPKA